MLLFKFWKFITITSSNICSPFFLFTSSELRISRCCTFSPVLHLKAFLSCWWNMYRLMLCCERFLHCSIYIQPILYWLYISFLEFLFRSSSNQPVSLGYYVLFPLSLWLYETFIFKFCVVLVFLTLGWRLAPFFHWLTLPQDGIGFFPWFVSFCKCLLSKSCF